MKYGKVVEGRIEWMPNTVFYEGRWISNPQKPVRDALGWKPVLENAPAPRVVRPGYHYERDGWADRVGIVVPKWKSVKDPPAPPRRWTRLSLKTALAQAEMLDAANAYLSGVEIATGYTAWEALTDADYIEEGFGGEEKWNALLDGAAVALGKTRSEIDAFLDALPAEGGV